MKTLNEIKSITGGEVVKAKRGHGSFIDIDVRRPDGGVLSLWVYLAHWALLYFEEEILSSDTQDPSRFLALEKLVGQMIKHVIVLEENEIHIGFTGNKELEIWPDEAYGKNVEMIRVYLNNVHIGDLTSP